MRGQRQKGTVVVVTTDENGQSPRRICYECGSCSLFFSIGEKGFGNQSMPLSPQESHLLYCTDLASEHKPSLRSRVEYRRASCYLRVEGGRSHQDGSQKSFFFLVEIFDMSNLPELPAALCCGGLPILFFFYSFFFVGPLISSGSFRRLIGGVNRHQIGMHGP